MHSDVWNMFYQMLQNTNPCIGNEMHYLSLCTWLPLAVSILRLLRRLTGVRLNAWTPCSCSATAFSGVFKVQGSLEKDLKSFRSTGWDCTFFFFHLFFTTQVAGCELFEDAVGGNGRIYIRPDSRPNDRTALESLRVKCQVCRTHTKPDISFEGFSVGSGRVPVCDK